MSERLPPVAANPSRVRLLIRALAAAREALRAELGNDVEAVLDPLSGSPILLRSGQDALVRSESHHQQLSTILANVRDAVVGVAPTGLVTFWNAGATALFGYAAEDMMGRPFAALFPDLTAEAAAAELAAVLAGREHRALRAGRRCDGETVWVDLRSAPLRDADGRLTGVLRLATDVGEHKRLEAELRRASEAAERANRAKSEFLANMSHEIRTPMNGIIGMTDIALECELDADVRRYLEVVRHSADALLAIINDVLDFSRIEAGKLSLLPEPFDLYAALDRPLKALALRAAEKRLTLVCRLAPDVPTALRGDAGRFGQVLINLVGNAIKFSTEGDVTVDVTCAQRSAAAVDLHVCVRDCGIGIPAEQQARIFAAFEQADGSSTRRYGGTGLGLTISASLVAMMDGRIWVESEPGRGSAFHFTARFAPRAGDGLVVPQALAGRRALLLDAHAASRDWVADCLSRWGLLVVAVAAPRDADAALAGAGDAPYDLVLADAGDGTGGVPWLGGLAADAAHAALPRVLLAGSTVRDALRHAGTVGAACVATPVSPPELLAAVCRAIAGEVSAGADPQALLPPAAAPRPLRRPLRVLVAEDQEINQELICRLLAKHGHMVALAGNGEEALERWRRERFDLVLMDVQMPVLDGLQTTAVIRAAELERGGHLPIIALTAHALHGDAARCLAAGMDAYVSKPLHNRDLLALLDRIAAGEGLAATPLAAWAERGDAAAPFDLARCLEMIGGERAILDRLAAAFLGGIGDRLTRLRLAIDRHDDAALQAEAHSLIGSLATFAAAAAEAAAQRLSATAGSGDLDDARQAFAVLDVEIGRLCSALTALPAAA